MKKLLIVLALVLMVTLSGCNKEEVYTEKEVNDLLSVLEDENELLSERVELLEGNQLISYRYVHYFDVFQIQFFKDESRVDWISFDIYSDKLEFRVMENSEEIEVFTSLGLELPNEANYFELTMYLFDELQSVSYNAVLYGLE